VILQGSKLVESARQEAQSMVSKGESARERALAILGSLRFGWKKRLELVRVG
jgi:hypothetical protein